MKGLTGRALCLAVIVCLCFSSPVLGAAKKRRAPPAPPKTAALVIEAETGLIIYAQDHNALRHPASLTKMMTLYLVFRALEEGRLTLETRLPVSRVAAQQPATKIGLTEGRTLSVRDAILSLVTISANDAAVVLAEGLGGSVEGFVTMMNRQARTLGMDRTVFRNPSGLPDKTQVSTAKDMAVLADALIQHYPGFYPYFSKTRHVFEGREMRSHNRLLGSYEGLDGLKTGYTNASGFNLAASAVRDGVRLIGVVFGGQTSAARNKRMAELLDKGFRVVQSQEGRRRLARGPLPEKAGYVALSSKGTGGSASSSRAQEPSMSVQGNFLIPPRSATVDPSRLWGLQIGAFSELSGAQRALEEALRVSDGFLRDAEKSLQKVTMTDGSVVYRARFMGIDQKTARSLCSRMIRNGQGCLVLSGG